MIKALHGYTPQVADSAFVAENAMVVGKVRIDDKASVWYGATLRGDVGSMRIGAMTNIQDNSVLHMDHGMELYLGENVTVGHLCIIHGCRIEGNVIVGMGSTIMNRAVIGKNTILGAGSLVTEGKTIGEGELWMGRPAKFIRKLNEEEVEGIKASALHYYENARAHKGGQE